MFRQDFYFWQFWTPKVKVLETPFLNLNFTEMDPMLPLVSRSVRDFLTYIFQVLFWYCLGFFQHWLSGILCFLDLTTSFGWFGKEGGTWLGCCIMMSYIYSWYFDSWHHYKCEKLTIEWPYKQQPLCPLKPSWEWLIIRLNLLEHVHVSSEFASCYPKSFVTSTRPKKGRVSHTSGKVW